MLALRVLLFAGVREAVGEREILVELADGATVEELRQELVRAFPQLAGIAPSLSVAVNREYCPDGTLLGVGDEVAIIPPVSGG